MTERGRGSGPCFPVQLAVCEGAGERKGLVRDGMGVTVVSGRSHGVGGNWGRHVCVGQCGSKK